MDGGVGDLSPTVPSASFVTLDKSCSHFLYWSQKYGIYCVSRPWRNCWCLAVWSAPIKASGGSQANATSTPKRVCKRIGSAKAALIGGAGEQSRMATEKSMPSGEKRRHSLSTSGIRRCPRGRGVPVAVPGARLWSQPGTGLGATLCR